MTSKNLNREVAVFLILTLFFTNASVWSQVRYNIIDLGSLPGYDISQAWSINNKGQIVGQVQNYSTSKAVLFDTSGNGNNIDLGSLGTTGSGALSINNIGKIVGAASSSATIFDSTGAGNNIGILANSAGWSINDYNQIVGSVTLNSETLPKKVAALFNFNQAGSYISLGTLPKYNSSEALSINNAGTAIGYAYNSSQTFDNLWVESAVMFDTANPGHIFDLGALPGYEYSLAFSINDYGQIVGRVNNHMDISSNYNPRAVLFDSNDPNNNLDLGTLIGYNAAEALSINNKGQIAGRAIQNNWQYSATLFDPSGKENNINLNDFIDSNLGWDLSTAVCVNDKGWIIGWGSKNNYSTSFLLIPIPAGPADFDENGKVDFYDFATFAAAWDSIIGDDNYNPACDLEPDGQINYEDLGIFVQGWSPSL